MTIKEFEQQVVLRYLGRWIENIEAKNIINYDEGMAIELRRDVTIVKEAMDVASCITHNIIEHNENFFDN